MSAEFETLDLNSSSHASNNNNNNNNSNYYGGASTPMTADSSGNSNFGTPAFATTGGGSGGYNQNNEGKSYASRGMPHQNQTLSTTPSASITASSGPESFSMPPPQQTGIQEEHFEYEGVALQTALNVASVAGGLARSVASKTGGIHNVVAGGLSNVTPSRIAGNMASWRGKIADVVAPVENDVVGPPVNVLGGGQCNNAQPPTPINNSFARGMSSESHGTTAAEIFAAPSPTVSPMLTSTAAPIHRVTPMQGRIGQGGGGNMQTVANSAQELFGSFPANQPPTQPAVVANSAHELFGTSSANNNKPPTHSSRASHLTMENHNHHRSSQMPPTSGNSWQMVQQQQNVGANGGATDFFNSSPTMASQQQKEPPKSQLSHRLSSLEKATHNPTSFQYNDPLEEGTATIVPGRPSQNDTNFATVASNVVLTSDARARNENGSQVTDTENTGVKNSSAMNDSTTEESATNNSTVNIAAGWSSSTPNEFPSAPATGGLMAMEVGKYSAPSAAEVQGSTTIEPPTTTTQTTHSTTHPVSSQPGSPMVGTTSKATPKVPTGRRLHLPIPKKANLPLPPPLPTRKKPPTSGNSSTSLPLTSKVGSGTATGGHTPFKKPPPMERVNAASPRFHVPGPMISHNSPRVSPRVTGTSPMPSPRTDESKLYMPQFPSPSPRVETTNPAELAVDVTAATPREEGATPEPLAVSSQVNEETIEKTQPQLSTTTDRLPDNDWNLVASSVVKDIVHDAVHHVSSHAVTSTVSEQAPPQPEVAPAAIYSATSPPIYSENKEFPETPSSRVTECDVMSDYQKCIEDDDVPTYAADDEVPSTSQPFSPPIPEGMGAVEDPSRGAVSCGNLESGVENPADDAAIPSLLPDGWIEATDPNTGKVYYCDQVTGESSWDKPCVVEKDDIKPPLVELVPGDVTVEEVKPELDVVDVTKDQPVNIEVCNNETQPDLFIEDEATETVSEDAPNDDALPKGLQELTDQSISYRSDDQPIADIERAPRPSEKVEVNDPEPEMPVESPQEEEFTKLAADKLPTGWAALTDVSSGKVYYFNEISGVSQWDRPALAEENIAPDNINDIEVRVDQVNQSQVSEDNEASPFSDDASTELTAVSAKTEESEHSANLSFESLPTGWIENIDTATGNIYYYNEDSNESSWERPVVMEENEEEQEVVNDAGSYGERKEEIAPNDDRNTNSEEVVGKTQFVDSSISTKLDAQIDEQQEVEERPPFDLKPLPPGWIESLDPTSGKTYYYNQVTNISSWEKPEIEEDKADVKPLREDEVANNVPIEEEAVSVESEIGGGFEEQEPVEEVVNIVDTEPTKIKDDINAPSESHEPESNTTLQDERQEDDWQEATSSSSRPDTYYNASTGATSWTKPETQADDTALLKQEDDAHKDTLVNDETVTIVPTTEDEVSADEQDTLKTTVETDNLGEEWTQVEHPSDGESVGLEEESIADLPNGWKQLTDPSSGNVYYYNEDTGESLWDRPFKVTEKQGESNKIKSNAVKAKNEEDEGVSDDLEPDHQLLIEKASHSVEEDVGPLTAQRNISVQSDEKNDELLEGWFEAKDPSSGKLYYYHAESGETSWERPMKDESVTEEQLIADIQNEHEVADELAPSQPTKEVPTSIEKTDEVPKDETEKLASSKLQDENDTAQLLEGWLEASDPSTGKLYYYHAQSGVTSWERPIKEDDGLLDPSSATDDATAPPSKSFSPTNESSTISNGNSPTLDAANPPLPEGWQQSTDPSSGKSYYYNDMSGETTWERPAAASISSTKDTSFVAVAQNRPRPAHAIANFGFGGRLCVMIPQVAATLSGAVDPVGEKPPLRRGPVVIHRLRSVVPQDHEYSIPSSPIAELFDVPLLKTHEDKVMSYLETKSLNPDNLLWNIIYIAAQNRGRLRNDKKVKKAIIEVLLASKPVATTNGDKKEPAHNMTLPSSWSADNVSDVQALLLRGDRESAVAEALTQQNYALALLIASMCDRTTYQITARRFADEVLQSGSPLHTATLLFSKNLKVPGDEELLTPRSGQSFWNDVECYGNLEETWRDQLASIYSNPSDGWERIVLALGDRLLQLGQCQAAHVCYLVSYSAFGPPSSQSTRLVLLGCDHRIYMNRMLMTPQSIQSFERTEAFEWSRRRGNRKTHIPSLQPFKFRYAELLADFGYEDLAREYLLSIRSCIGLDSGKGKGGKATTPTSGNLAYELEFIESLKRLDDRICTSTGAKPSSWESSKDDDAKTGSLASVGSIVKSVLGKKIKADDMPPSDDKLPKQASEKQIVEEEVVDESPREVAQLCMPEKQQQRQPNPIDDAFEGGDESFITAKPSFDQTAVAVDDDSPMSPPKLISNSSIDAPPSSAPPMFPNQTSKPKEEKKKETILSTPIQASKKAGKEKAPVSEPPRSAGWLSSGLKKASKLLGRDPDSKAVVCDPGLAMEAYYDEKLKRWIFPGDDPAEVAKPLAPPPTIPKTTDGPSTPAPSVASSNDPLAALMAPPPSGVLSRNKRGTPSLGMSRYSASPLTSIGNVPPSNNKAPPASPMVATPPTFATFVPKPSQKETDPSQEETHGGTQF